MCEWSTVFPEVRMRRAEMGWGGQACQLIGGEVTGNASGQAREWRLQMAPSLCRGQGRSGMRGALEEKSLMQCSGEESQEIGDKWGSFSPVWQSQGRNEKRAGPPSHVPLPPERLLTQVSLSVCQAGMPILKQSPSHSSEPSASLQLSLSLCCQLTERIHLTVSLVSTRSLPLVLQPHYKGLLTHLSAEHIPTQLLMRSELLNSINFAIVASLDLLTTHDTVIYIVSRKKTLSSLRLQVSLCILVLCLHAWWFLLTL